MIKHAVQNVFCMGCNEYYVRLEGREHNRSCTQILLSVRQVDTTSDMCASHLLIPYKSMPFFKINSTNPTLKDSEESYFIKITKAKLIGSL